MNEMPAQPASKSPLNPLIAHAFAAPKLLNVERAYEIMDKYGLSGIVASIPHNIYYLSSHSGIMQWMGRHFSSYAFFPRDENAAPALIAQGTMLYHFDYRPTWIENIKAISGPALSADGQPLIGSEGEPLARPEPGIWPVRAGAEMSRGDKIQLALFDKFRGKTVVSALQGLKQALSEAGVADKAIGFDDPRVGAWLQDIGLSSLQPIDACNIFKEIRLVKTPREIELLRAAAQTGEAALLHAISQITPGQPLADIEHNFSVEWAKRGGTAKWLIANVNGVNSGTIETGDWMKLDSVGTLAGYHGDIGRTVVLGPPPEELARRIEADTKISRIVYDSIRPGMRYIEAFKMFGELMKDEGFNIAFAGPHDVGLEHTDHPIETGGKNVPASIPYTELVFHEGTVFTLDMPHNEIGWGTVHVEDMLVVRKTGCELLSSGDTSLKQVG